MIDPYRKPAEKSQQLVGSIEIPWSISRYPVLGTVSELQRFIDGYMARGYRVVSHAQRRIESRETCEHIFVFANF